MSHKVPPQARASDLEVISAQVDDDAQRLGPVPLVGFYRDLPLDMSLAGSQLISNPDEDDNQDGSDWLKPCCGRRAALWQVCLLSAGFNCFLVLCVVVVVLLLTLELLIDTMLLQFNNAVQFACIIHWISLVILSLFFTETVFRIVVLGIWDYIENKVEVFDGAVIVLSLAPMVASTVANGPSSPWDAIGLIVTLRIWRVKSIIDAYVLQVKVELEMEIQQFEKAKAIREEQLERLTHICQEQAFEIRQLRAHLAQQDLDLSAEREVALQMHRLWGKRNSSFHEVDGLEQRGSNRTREAGEATEYTSALKDKEKDVRKWKEELLEQRRKMMEEKLLHAELKREVQLQAIVKKAQEEEAKVNEIAFINTLEAQNKRHDALAKLNEYEQRLNELQEERQRRQEEKQARDEAVQERKRVLEAERQARVEELLTKRKEQEARIELQRQEKERAREDAARERARDREERLAALSAAQQEAMEELQKKIQMKHDESSRRHMEQIEQRKEKAAELSSGRHANTDYAPKLTPYERKKHCSLCSVLITSEVHLISHTKGKQHQQAVRDSSSIQGRELSDEEVEHLSLKKYIVDIVTDSSVSSESPKDTEERQKARKRAKKLRTRMNSRAKEYETLQEAKAKAQVPDSPYKAKLQRLVRDLLKQLQVQDSGPWCSSRVSALDRTLGEISRILEKQNNADQVAFQVSGGLAALAQILQVFSAASTPNAVPRIPVKSLCAAVNTFFLSCASCASNCSYVLFSNKIALLMDLLLHQLTLYVPDEDKSIFGRSVNKLVFEGLTTGLLQTLSSILSSLWPPLNDSGERISSPDAKMKGSAPDPFFTRTQDLISYVVNVGLVDKLYGVFLSIQSPVDDCPKMSSFLREASALLHNICRLCYVVTGRAPSIFDNKRQDPTGLSSLLQRTDLVGVVHTLYSILLHAFPESSSHCQEPYSSGVIQVALNGIRFLNSFALLDLPAFQSVLGAEGLSLAFRHVVSSLLWYCSQHSSQSLLHEVIICVGYFTVNHPDNQGIMQSGRQPSVLQKLCLLPFQYFSHPGLIRVLFPSLISATYNNLHNKVILQQELSCVLLATFIQDCASIEKECDSKTKQTVSPMPDYRELSLRFPRDQWDSALKFFLQN
uniref:U1-type domain-containing protein n=1 Tax=Knipowitschia caucasica TaxID=637954 RepID=A0AAV2L0V9_KNICA